MNEFKVDHLDQLKWLALVAGCAAAAVYGFARRRRALRALADEGLLGVLAPDLSRPRQYVRAGMVVLAMAAIVFALIGPRYGAYFEDVQRRQLDLVVCLDVSKSMLAEDAGMSRLDRAKDDVKRLLDRLVGGKIGLVCFAGRAELTCPLTDDYEFYRMALEEVGIHSAPLGGSHLREAIVAAVKTLGDQENRQRAILLMTDGEDHGDGAVEEAKKAFEAGIKVYAIGIGDESRGGLIPIDKDGGRTYLMHDGQQMWSKMDPAALTVIALAGGGEYQPSRQVNSRQRTLDWLYSEKLVAHQQAELKQKQVTRQYPRFAWPTVLALALLAVEPFVSERRGTGLRGKVGPST